MSPTRISLVLGTTLSLGACATAASTPVVAYPGPSKDAATFQKDETACRTAAAQAAYPNGAKTQAMPAPAPDGANAEWERYFAAYSQCEASHGNSVHPVPWAAAYAAYLGYGAPYAYGPGYAYGYGYPYAYGYPFFYGYPYYYGYPFLYGPYFAAFYGGFHGGFHGGGFHR
jgi:hypothetical protein